MRELPSPAGVESPAWIVSAWLADLHGAPDLAGASCLPVSASSGTATGKPAALSWHQKSGKQAATGCIQAAEAVFAGLVAAKGYGDGD